VIHLTATKTYRGSSSNVAVDNALSGMVNIGSALLLLQTVRCFQRTEQVCLDHWTIGPALLDTAGTATNKASALGAWAATMGPRTWCTVAALNIAPANISVPNDAFAWSIVLLIADGRF
jgi:hypothetical protein